MVSIEVHSINRTNYGDNSMRIAMDKVTGGEVYMSARHFCTRGDHLQKELCFMSCRLNSLISLGWFTECSIMLKMTRDVWPTDHACS